jgi:hypothetical protein
MHSIRVVAFLSFTAAASIPAFAKDSGKDSLNTTLDSLIMKLSGQRLEILGSLANIDPNLVVQGLANIDLAGKPQATNEYYSDGHTKYFIRNPMQPHVEAEVAGLLDNTRKTQEYYFDGEKRYYIENPKSDAVEIPKIIVPPLKRK